MPSRLERQQERRLRSPREQTLALRRAIEDIYDPRVLGLMQENGLLDLSPVNDATPTHDRDELRSRSSITRVVHEPEA